MRITDYVIKKWAKAGLHIFLGIILLIYLENALIEMQPAFNFIFGGGVPFLVNLLGAIGWVLIIWCFVSAALNLIMSFRESKLSFDDLGRKLDSIEKRLWEQRIYTQAEGPAIGQQGVMGTTYTGQMAAVSTLAQPIPPPEEAKKGSKRLKIAVIAVVVILIIAALAVGLMFFGFGGSSSAGGSTPEQAFTAFIDKMNAKDANGAIGNTVWTFSSDRAQYVSALNQLFSSGTFHLTVVSNQITQKQNLNSTARNEMDSQSNDLQQQLNINISDYVAIDFTVSVQTSQGTASQSKTMMCAQVGDKWYVVFEFEGQGPGQQQSTPEQTFSAFIDMLNNRDSYGAVNLTVMKFSGNYQQEVASFETNIFGNSATFNIQVASSQVIYSGSFSSTQNSEMASDMSMVSSEYGKTVQEYVLIQFTGTQTNDSGPQSISDTIPCVKIDDEWYLIVGGPGGPGPIEIHLNKANATGNWTVDIANIDNTTGPMPTSDIYIEVKYANGTVALNKSLSSIGGNYWNGTQFNDMGTPGVDSGDNFILDSSMYFDGTELKLMDSTGTTIYSDIIL
jgi:hypothetical protein